MHKKKQTVWFLIAFLAAALLVGEKRSVCFAVEQAVDETTEAQPDVKPEESYTIKAQKGNKYCYNSAGKKITKKFVTIKNSTYYFGSSGVMEKGWMKKGSQYYYFDRDTGKMKSGCKVDGIKLKKNGTAEKNSYSVSKINTMMTAKKIMQKNSKATDNKKVKLKKMFMWVMKHPYNRYRILNQARSKKGWEMEFANDVYKKGKGCCVSEACAFAFLAHECGYKNVYVCDDTGHAWTEINGRVYDTLFAEAKNGGSYKHPDFAHYYNASYGAAGLYHGPLMGKKKI